MAVSSNPELLYQHMPSAYDQHVDSDQYKFMAGLAKATNELFVVAQDFVDDQSIATADGDGLTRLGELYGIGRPPGFIDTHFRDVLLAIVGARRGTIQAIKTLYEAIIQATGATVEDRQTNPVIPYYEIWITPPVVASSDGRWMYPGIGAPMRPSLHPIQSSIGGVVYSAGGYAGGLYNDHAYGLIDKWAMDLLNKVKLAGTKIIFK